MCVPGTARFFGRARRLRNNHDRCDSVAEQYDGIDTKMNAIAMGFKVDSYADLLQQIRNDLRLQHPEWIQPNGQCPMCDSYEARLSELLDASIPGESNDNIVVVSDITSLPNAKNSLSTIFV